MLWGPACAESMSNDWDRLCGDRRPGAGQTQPSIRPRAKFAALDGGCPVPREPGCWLPQGRPTGVVTWRRTRTEPSPILGLPPPGQRGNKMQFHSVSSHSWRQGCSARGFRSNVWGSGRGRSVPGAVSVTSHQPRALLSTAQGLLRGCYEAWGPVTLKARCTRLCPTCVFSPRIRLSPRDWGRMRHPPRAACGSSWVKRVATCSFVFFLSCVFSSDDLVQGQVWSFYRDVSCFLPSLLNFSL